MRKRLILVPSVIVALLFISLYGCPNPEKEDNWAWNANRPQRIQDTFSHEVHKKIFEKENFQCLTCHTMDLGIENEEDIDKLTKLSDKSFFPGKETCHFCHYNPEAGNIGPGNCSICHFNLEEIQPANHNFDWLSKHAVFAKSDMGKCENCHTQAYCQDCHNRRDQPTRRFHDRNYRFVHGIEARVNPSRCGNCHQTSFCDKCHVEGGYDR